MKAKKKVSVGWQCVAILFVPTGLWAFYRIKKLLYGVLIYLAALGLKFGIPIVLAMLYHDSNFDSDTYWIIFNLLSFVGFFTALGLSMWYMARWSNRWNESVDRENTQSQTDN